MIYVTPAPADPIRQGDIFRGVPRVEIRLDKLSLVEITGLVESSWKDVLKDGTTEIAAVAAIRPVDAIVVTQDCDAVRSPSLTLCEICEFADVEGRAKDASKPSSLFKIITQHARVNQKWFYLPADPKVGFESRKGVDFRRVIQVQRDQLEDLAPSQRVSRLNDVAAPHFRERLAEFFRRYPYDEWYPLNREELEAYKKSVPGDVKPFDWQL